MTVVRDHAVSAQEQQVGVMERHRKHPTPGGVSHVYFYTPDDRLADSTDWRVADLAPQPDLGDITLAAVWD